jgi:hypothetical protein
VDASLKLRSDKYLQQAEVARTKSLAALKAEKAKAASIEKARQLNEESLLRKKTVPIKQKSGNKHQKIIYSYLGVKPPRDTPASISPARQVPVRAGTNTGGVGSVSDSKQAGAQPAGAPPVAAVANQPLKNIKDPKDALKLAIDSDHIGATESRMQDEAPDDHATDKRNMSSVLKREYSKRLNVPTSGPLQQAVISKRPISPRASPRASKASLANGQRDNLQYLNADIVYGLSNVSKTIQEGGPDIWDEIIESVILIADSRDSSAIRGFLTECIQNPAGAEISKDPTR